MSKWIKKDLFDTFQKEKIEEKDNSSGGGFIRSNLVWDTPEKGTIEQAKIYEGRFLPDPKGEFYKRYYYHFWQSGETWKFVLCPKTNDFKEYCPFCSSVSKLYNGTEQDKKQAYLLKRKDKFVGNFFIVKDPRDAEKDDENKVVGKVRLYEFPAKVEQKLKNEITDREEGYGREIFDPSEEGRNFILKVLSTKKQEDGRTWPDYSSSTFSRSQSALGSEEEIDDIMASCTDLEEYLKSRSLSKDKQVEILKNEFLWELVESECLKHGYIDVESNGDDSKNNKREENFDTGRENNRKEEDKKEELSSDSDVREEVKKDDDNKISVDDLDDDDLLRELDSM